MTVAVDRGAVANQLKFGAGNATTTTLSATKVTINQTGTFNTYAPALSVAAANVAVKNAVQTTRSFRPTLRT